MGSPCLKWTNRMYATTFWIGGKKTQRTKETASRLQMHDGDWIKFLEGGNVKSLHLCVPENVYIALEKAKEEACMELERIASKDTLYLIKEKQHLQTALECKIKQIDEIIKKSEEGKKGIKLAADTEELGMIMVEASQKSTE